MLPKWCLFRKAMLDTPSCSNGAAAERLPGCQPNSDSATSTFAPLKCGSRHAPRRR